VLGIIRAPGTSLEESCRMNTRIEKLLLEQFPTRSPMCGAAGHAGSGQDAGAIEATDMFIALKPRDQWKKAAAQQQRSWS